MTIINKQGAYIFILKWAICSILILVQMMHFIYIQYLYKYIDTIHENCTKFKEIQHGF